MLSRLNNILLIDNYVEINGRKVHFIEKGYGYPLVLVHGLSSCTYTWRNNIDVLSRYFRVIALDLPGFGLSERPLDFKYGYHGFVKFIESFLGNLGIKKAHFIGHSFGGGVCQLFASKYPAKVDSLILVSTSNFNAGRRGLNQKAMKNILLFTYKDKSLITQEMVKLYEEVNDNESNGMVMGILTRNLDALNETENLSKLSGRCIIIWGTDDAIYPHQQAWKIKQIFQDAAVRFISDCGHAPHEERADELNELVIEFLLKEEIRVEGSLVGA